MPNEGVADVRGSLLFRQEQTIRDLTSSLSETEILGLRPVLGHDHPEVPDQVMRLSSARVWLRQRTVASQARFTQAKCTSRFSRHLGAETEPHRLRIHMNK